MHGIPAVLVKFGWGLHRFPRWLFLAANRLSLDKNCIG